MSLLNTLASLSVVPTAQVSSPDGTTQLADSRMTSGAAGPTAGGGKNQGAYGIYGPHPEDGNFTPSQFS